MHFVKSTLLLALISTCSLFANAEELAPQETHTSVRQEADFEPKERANIEGGEYDSLVYDFSATPKTYVVNADVPGHDWRHEQGWKGSDLFNWALQNGAMRSFNYYTYGRNKLWFNYSLDWNSRLIQYQIVDARSGGVLQTGYTTATMKMRTVYYPTNTSQAGYNPNVPQVEFAFDVQFGGNTLMKKYFYVRSEKKNIFWEAQARGYIADSPDYNQFKSNFEVTGGWALP